MPKVVSQRTIVEIMRALREAGRNYTRNSMRLISPIGS